MRRFLPILFFLTLPLAAEDVSYQRAMFDMTTSGTRAVLVTLANNGSKKQTETVTVRIQTRGSSQMLEIGSKTEEIPAHSGMLFEIPVPADTVKAEVVWRGLKKNDVIVPGAPAKPDTIANSGKDCSKNNTTIRHKQKIRDKGRVMQCNNGEFKSVNDGFAGFCPSGFDIDVSGTRGRAEFSSLSILSHKSGVQCFYKINVDRYRKPSGPTGGDASSVCSLDPKKPRVVVCLKVFVGFSMPESYQAGVQDYVTLQKHGTADGKWASGNGETDSEGTVKVNFVKSSYAQGKGFQFTYQATDARLKLELNPDDFAPCKSQSKDKFSCPARVVKEFN